ncbi:MAG: prepilin-type N-terminal cleavage/methylation domain-containing protein [Verrucomicrobiota bacterium]
MKDKFLLKRLPGRRGLRAFSLVELLVVISILAILLVLLLPVVWDAMEYARVKSCASNLRQVALAANMFATDQGHYPGAQTGVTTEIDGVRHTVAWFGAFSARTGNFDAERGHLGGYWGEANVGGCPTTDNDDREQYGPVDYAYNVLYLGARFHEGYEAPYGVQPGNVQRPAETVFFFDSARLQGGGVGRVPWGYPPTGLSHSYPPESPGYENPTFHARHRNMKDENVGNVVWVDGHVSTMKPTWYSSYNGAPISTLKDEKIGDLDPNDDDVRDNDLFDLE